MEFKFNSLSQLQTGMSEGTLINDFLNNCDKNQFSLINNSLDLLNLKTTIPTIISAITMELCKNIVPSLDLTKVLICDHISKIKDFNLVTIDTNMDEFELMNVYDVEGMNSIIDVLQKALISYLNSVTETNDCKLYLYAITIETGHVNPIRPLVASTVIKIYMKLAETIEKEPKSISYVGTKIIDAVPSVKDGEEGYAIEYEDGYKSWSPKDTFEESYESFDNMDFSKALHLLHQGFDVARHSWNAPDQYITVIRAGNAVHRGLPMQDCLALKNARDEMQPGWVPSQGDLFATDWYVVNKPFMI